LLIIISSLNIQSKEKDNQNYSIVRIAIQRQVSILKITVIISHLIHRRATLSILRQRQYPYFNIVQRFLSNSIIRLPIQLRIPSPGFTFIWFSFWSFMVVHGNSLICNSIEHFCQLKQSLTFFVLDELLLLIEVLLIFLFFPSQSLLLFSNLPVIALF